MGGKDAGRQTVREKAAGVAEVMKRLGGVWHHRRLVTEAAMGWVMVGLELSVVAIIAIALWLALRK